MATPSHFFCNEKKNTYKWVNECVNDEGDWPENVYFVSEQANYFMIFKEENTIHIYECDEDATFKKYPIENLYICKDDEYAFICYKYLCSYMIKRVLTPTCPPNNGKDSECNIIDNVAAFMAELENSTENAKTYLSIVSSINEINTTSDIVIFRPERCGDSCSYSYAIDAEYIYLLSQNCEKIPLTDYPLDTNPFDPYSVY